MTRVKIFLCHKYVIKFRTVKEKGFIVGAIAPEFAVRSEESPIIYGKKKTHKKKTTTLWLVISSDIEQGHGYVAFFFLCV